MLRMLLFRSINPKCLEKLVLFVCDSIFNVIFLVFEMIFLIGVVSGVVELRDYLFCSELSCDA